MANLEEVKERIRLDKIQKLKIYEGSLRIRLTGGIADKELKAFVERDLARTLKRIAVLGG